MPQVSQNINHWELAMRLPCIMGPFPPEHLISLRSFVRYVIPNSNIYCVGTKRRGVLGVVYYGDRRGDRETMKFCREAERIARFMDSDKNFNPNLPISELESNVDSDGAGE